VAEGEPARVTVSAEPLPGGVLRQASLRLVIDDETVDLTGPRGRYWELPCPFPENCIPSGVEAELEPSVVRSVVEAKAVDAWVLGFPVRLVAGDREAVREFARKSGLASKD
jgi:hypothetical protein